MKCGHCKEEGVTLAHVKACSGVFTGGEKLPDTVTMLFKPPAPDTALSFDEVEAAGLDATLRGMASHPSAGVVVTKLRFVDDGYYTVVFSDAEDDRITLRVRPHWEEEAVKRGEKVVDYLMGQDNERDYKGFAFLTPHGKRMWNVWKRFASNERLARALEVLHKDPEEAGMAYALRSGNCYRCGRTLTVPASIHRGLGPVCAKGGRDA